MLKLYHKSLYRGYFRWGKNWRTGGRHACDKLQYKLTSKQKTNQTPWQRTVQAAKFHNIPRISNNNQEHRQQSHSNSTRANRYSGQNSKRQDHSEYLTLGTPLQNNYQSIYTTSKMQNTKGTDQALHYHPSLTPTIAAHLGQGDHNCCTVKASQRYEITFESYEIGLHDLKHGTHSRLPQEIKATTLTTKET